MPLAISSARPGYFSISSAVREAVLAHRIGREAGNGLGLRRARQNLEQQRVARVAFAHPRDEPARHEQRKVARRDRVERARRQLEQTAELGDVADRVPNCRSPSRGAEVGRGESCWRGVYRLNPRFVFDGS